MFPAQALAETLTGEGWEVAMMTDARGAKHTGRIPADPIIEVEAASISFRKPLAAFGGLVKLARGVVQATHFMREWRPHVVAGFGGYPAFPAVRAAQSLGIPTVLHEQNAVLGRVNRAFAGKADAVASGFDALSRMPKGVRHVATGNPLRAQVVDAVPDSYAAPGPQDDIQLLVVGGSLGARIVSQVVPKAVAALPDSLRARLVVVQQTTEDELEAARATYAEAGVRATCETFFSDIQTHLAAAHLVVARAGASSVSEIALMGKPSILVPLAIAMDDHQTANARSLADRDAAIILPESAFTPEALSGELERRLTDAHWLESAARAARDTARPDAARALAALVTQAARTD